MDLSIIVPEYNVENYISECLESVLAQTYENLEIIIVDDGSTDNTYKILSEFAHKENRVKLFHQENKGVVAARAKGVSESHGSLIGFVDADDYIDAKMYETLYREISGADIVSCSANKQWSKGRTEIIHNQFANGAYTGDEYKRFVASMIYDFGSCESQRVTPWLWNKLFKRQIFEKIDTTELLGISNFEDVIILYEYLINAKSIRFIDDVLYYYRFRENSAFRGENCNYLVDVGRMYSILKTHFEESEYRDILIPQLQKMTQVLVFSGFERNMKFDWKFSPIQFTTDFGEFKGKKIILYGAGRCGKDFHKQLLAYGYDVCLWCDSDTSIGHYGGFEISTPEIIPDCMEKNEDPLVLVAVNNEERANNIIDTLINLGVDKKCIIWRKPFKVY